MLEYKKTVELILKSQNILLLTHKKPDGDALGSMCAFIGWFNLIQKKYTAIVDVIPETFSFLPFCEKIQILDSIILNNVNFDIIITMDFNEIYRTPAFELLLKAQQNNIPIINIDHHQNNKKFANMLLVNESAGSTTHIIYELFRENNIKITPQIATCLLTGILTDTDHLTNGATTQKNISAVGNLIGYGAHLYKITKKTRGNKNVQTMNLWGEVLKRIKINTKLNIAYTVITNNDLQKYNVSSEQLEGIPNFLTVLDNVNAILVLKEEQNNEIRGSFRTIKDNIDLSKLAKLFGGGGHKKASGFTLKGNLLQTETGWKIE